MPFRSISSGGRYEVLSVTTATGGMRGPAYRRKHRA
jgi:hypothetical protein